MSSFLAILFSTEFTCVPGFIETYFGDYYSNATGNVLTWVFFMWIVVHFIFDSYLNILFKKMQYKEYLSFRLVDALWYAGFYGTAFLYSVGTLLKNNTKFADFYTNLVKNGGDIPMHILMGLGLVGTFFAHSVFWEGMKDGVDSKFMTLFLTSILPLMTYYSRRTELFLALFSLVCFIHFMYNVLRSLACIMKKKTNSYLNGVFFGVMGIFTVVHIIIIPIFFIVPLLFHFPKEMKPSIILLASNITCWWISEAFSNPLFKYIEHWIRHSDVKDPRICPNNLLECCLFPIRDDISFNIAVEKHEIKKRATKSVQRRKPKDRGVFVQTLKCMVAIRRKMNKNRAAHSEDDSDSDDREQVAIDGREPDSSEEESSSSEEGEETEEVKMKREYQEETARALMEDKETSGGDKREDSSSNEEINGEEGEDSDGNGKKSK